MPMKEVRIIDTTKGKYNQNSFFFSTQRLVFAVNQKHRTLSLIESKLGFEKLNGIGTDPEGNRRRGREPEAAESSTARSRPAILAVARTASGI